MRRLDEFFPEELRSALGARELGIAVAGVTGDSREAAPGMIFVATRGESQDGHRFIGQAAQNGAALILGETEPPPGLSCPYIRVASGRLALARVASAYHGHPSRSMLMVGVTGTSGKTTTTYLLEAILKAAGREPGVIGTVNFRYRGKVLASTHTTPGPVELQRLLAEMRDAGCTAVVMEVSSHALKQRRVAELAFDAMVFTNLSREHLDFHPDMEDYFGSKALLFTELAETSARAGKSPVAAIFADDEYGRRLLRELSSKPGPLRKVISFGVAPGAEISGASLEVDLGGIRGLAAGVAVRSALTGTFNVSNILGAIAAATGLGIAPEAIARGISAVSSVPGRLEAVPNEQGLHVLVDYAHKPDALEKVLRTLAEVKGPHRLITVFGCGGDRDRTKRPVMGRLAAELSDWAWVTSDNPRTEDPGRIIGEILAGMAASRNFTVEPDRKKAIFEAIRQAQAGDIVLIAGKGHEDYQIVADPSSPTGTRKTHFDDREVAREAFGRRPQSPPLTRLSESL